MRLGTVLFIVSAFFSLSICQQATTPDLPKTPVGKHVEAYLKAFNSGEEAMKVFFQDHASKDALKDAPVEQRVGRYRQMHERLGSLTLEKVVESRDDFVSAQFRTGNGDRVRLDFEFEKSAPYGLVGIRVEDTGAENLPANRKGNNAELIAAVTDLLTKSSGSDDFSGVVLIAQNGKPIFEKAYGYADREQKIPNRTDTNFNLGSINKSFAALAIRQLAEKGKLSLSDPIRKFLPDYPNKEAATKVTIQHLLAMTSGIGDFFGERCESTPKEKLRTLKDYLPLFADKPLEFEPGARNRYSNGGFVVLGLIIEKASGSDYYAYVRDNIFKPAGMTETESFEKDAATPNRAVGYVREGSVRKPNYESLPGRGSSAGGGYSTVEDLLKYTIALEKGTITPDGKSDLRGFGIAGGAPGLNSALEWNPKSSYVVVVMSNFDPPTAERVARQIRSWLPE
jgi:D-alanyl-D-alanine carboxypeptidase